MFDQGPKIVVFESFVGFTFSKFSIYFFLKADLKKFLPQKWVNSFQMEQNSADLGENAPSEKSIGFSGGHIEAL